MNSGGSDNNSFITDFNLSSLVFYFLVAAVAFFVGKNYD
jgi:hypothetical protein